jgi:hypothetical protein
MAQRFERLDRCVKNGRFGTVHGSYVSILPPITTMHLVVKWDDGSCSGEPDDHDLVKIPKDLANV